MITLARKTNKQQQKSPITHAYANEAISMQAECWLRGESRAVRPVWLWFREKPGNKQHRHHWHGSRGGTRTRWQSGALSAGSLQWVCLMNSIPSHCSEIFRFLPPVVPQRPVRNEPSGGSPSESLHPLKINVFKEGQSLPAFLGLSFILGPVAQITQ